MPPMAWETKSTPVPSIRRKRDEEEHKEETKRQEAPPRLTRSTNSSALDKIDEGLDTFAPTISKIKDSSDSKKAIAEKRIAVDALIPKPKDLY